VIFVVKVYRAASMESASNFFSMIQSNFIIALEIVMPIEVVQRSYTIGTNGRGTQEITDKIQDVIASTTIISGLVHIFVHHTSASLMLCENADPAVRRDMEMFMAGIAPDGDSRYEHSSEGPDDMPAHIRSVLTTTGMSIPIIGRSLWPGNLARRLSLGAPHPDSSTQDYRYPSWLCRNT